MNHHCATCARPLSDRPMPRIGPVRFCSDLCIRNWFADGKHRDRRTRYVPVAHEDRRTS